MFLDLELCLFNLTELSSYGGFMKKNKFTLLLCVSIIVLVGGFIGTAYSLYSHNLYLAKELSASRDKLSRLNSEIEDLRTQIIKLNMTIEEYATRMTELDATIEENAKLNKQIADLNATLKEIAEMAENETNNLMSTVVIEYTNTLNKIDYHLTAMWEDKDRYIWVRNYKVNGALYHLEHVMWLIKHAYWLVKPYSNESEFFQLLSGIMCNNTFGDIISALQLVYGHIYAFNVSLGTHEIDVYLLKSGCETYIPKIYKILSKIEINGLAPRDQLTNEDYNNLQRYFQNLNNIVSEYLQKPGTDIS